MPSLKRFDGELLIDHRGGPGVSEESAHNAGMPPGSNAGMMTMATITCSHCQRVVILNPNRKRDRAYCPKCDKYLCDGCGRIRSENGGECTPFVKVLDEAQEAAGKLLVPSW